MPKMLSFLWRIQICMKNMKKNSRPSLPLCVTCHSSLRGGGGGPLCPPLIGSPASDIEKAMPFAWCFVTDKEETHKQRSWMRCSGADDPNGTTRGAPLLKPRRVPFSWWMARCPSGFSAVHWICGAQIRARIGTAYCHCQSTTSLTTADAPQQVVAQLMNSNPSTDILRAPFSIRPAHHPQS